MDLSNILQSYADMMNETCQYNESCHYTKYEFTYKDLNIKHFMNYCAYKAFENDGIMWDWKLCDSCEKQWNDLRELFKLPGLLRLLNKQQRIIEELQNK